MDKRGEDEKEEGWIEREKRRREDEMKVAVHARPEGTNKLLTGTATQQYKLSL